MTDGNDSRPGAGRRPEDRERLRIALVAPPFVAVPPPRYGGTERVVATLAAELTGRGHDVTVFACTGSHVAARLVATAPGPASKIDWDDRKSLDATASVVAADDRRTQFDVIHSHLGGVGVDHLRRHFGEDPRFVHTVHLPVDWPDERPALRRAPGVLVALSQAQAALGPELRWIAAVPNGLTFDTALPDVSARPPSDDLCFVGRIDPEKGILDAIEIARLSGRRLRIAAKVGGLPEQRDYFERVVKPALDRANVEYLGEITEDDRDRLFAESYATLVPPRWPEPFGLVTVESLAHGTPVLAFGVGALPEVVRDGVDGFLETTPGQLAARMPDVANLDRSEIAASARDRFSARRMADGYEQVYRAVAARAALAVDR